MCLKMDELSRIRSLCSCFEFILLLTGTHVNCAMLLYGTDDNCQFWSPWGTCSSICGGGVKTRVCLSSGTPEFNDCNTMQCTDASNAFDCIFTRHLGAQSACTELIALSTDKEACEERCIRNLVCYSYMYDSSQCHHFQCISTTFAVSEVFKRDCSVGCTWMYIGGNLVGNCDPLSSGQHVSDSSECLSLCRADPRCKSVTYQAAVSCTRLYCMDLLKMYCEGCSVYDKDVCEEHCSYQAKGDGSAGACHRGSAQSTSHIGECALACDVTNSCVGFTFNHGTSDCYLQECGEYLTVSVRTYELNEDGFAANGIGTYMPCDSLEQGTYTLSQCKDKCMSEDSCQSITYDTVTQQCSIHQCRNEAVIDTQEQFYKKECKQNCSYTYKMTITSMIGDDCNDPDGPKEVASSEMCGKECDDDSSCVGYTTTRASYCYMHECLDATPLSDMNCYFYKQICPNEATTRSTDSLLDSTSDISTEPETTLYTETTVTSPGMGTTEMSSSESTSSIGTPLISTSESHESSELPLSFTSDLSTEDTGTVDSSSSESSASIGTPLISTSESHVSSGMPLSFTSDSSTEDTGTVDSSSSESSASIGTPLIYTSESHVSSGMPLSFTTESSIEDTEVSESFTTISYSISNEVSTMEEASKITDFSTDVIISSDKMSAVSNGISETSDVIYYTTTDATVVSNVTSMQGLTQYLDLGLCKCTCGFTNESIHTIFARRLEDLVVDKSSTSKWLRTLTCAEDERPVSKSVGAVGAMIVASVPLIIIASDIINGLLKIGIKR